MKKIPIMAFMLSIILTGWHGRASAQADEIAQLLLNVEKLAQFRGILSDMKKGYEILNGGYNTIKNISEGNFSIHKDFLDGLMDVSPAVKNYRKIPMIINKQLLLTSAYKKAFQRFVNSSMFSEKELAYIERVYGNLIKQSLSNLDELILVITAGKMRMSDDERLKAIDRIHIEMEDKLSFLQHFNQSASILEVQRREEKANIKTSEMLHDVEKK